MGECRFFGTDGIRGRVGDYPINELFCWRMGHALARFLRRHDPAPPATVVIGRDTRASGKRFEQCIQQALLFNGITVHKLGVVPTPAISKAVCDLSAGLGIVVTASHNSATDNGIKLFDHRGMKFSSDEEILIEGWMGEGGEDPLPGTLPVDGVVQADGKVVCCDAGAYIGQLCSMLPANCLAGWTIVLDTANGATVATSPAVFRHYGADLIQLGNTPDGQNINAGVGSEHPSMLAARVKATTAHLGIAHDGDGDRLILCDELGSVLSGEELLGLIAIDALQRNILKHNTLVTTVHSNMGLDHAIRSAGGHVERVAVGDRNILLRMVAAGYTMGGESSGHYIFLADAVTGDGLLAALKVIDIMLRTKRPLSELRKQVQLLPQETRNLKVAHQRPLQQCECMQTAIEEIENELSDTGRLLVRYSGTEPKLRLLVEGKDTAQIARAMEKLAAAAQLDLE